MAAKGRTLTTPVTPAATFMGVVKERAVAYVFGNSDGTSLSSKDETIEDCTLFAEEWLRDNAPHMTDPVREQTVFALVPVRVLETNGVTVTDVKE